ncbi:DUF805 domain-containing protein [Corticibacterium sp. UT-5YL-CI-8]|nr:DUF805 domain-containing protein [Tianweitania sp. UT-5YL-CI-8]
MPDSSLFFWLFFGTSGRLGRGVFALACALSYLARFFAVYQVVRYSTETEPSTGWTTVLLITLLVSLWANVALSIKRLHDLGLPGLWAIPTVVFDILAIIVLALLPGNPGPNRYGERTNQPR